MNPQPNPTIGNIFAFIFVAMIMYHFLKAFHDQSRHINVGNMDLVTFGYVENSPVYILDKTKKDFLSTQLFKDCVDALYALGAKKSEAKKTATAIFTNSDPQPQSVQEFLMLALRK